MACNRWSRILAGATLMASLAVFAGCAAPEPTAYGPRTGRFGYEETKLDAGTWRVSFTANRFTPRGRAEDFALYRAAEIALAGGFPRFAVIDRTFDRHTERTYAYRVYPPGLDVPESRWSGRDALDPFESTRLIVNEWLVATLVVRPYRSKAPAGAVRLYDARAEMERLGPAIRRR